MARKSESDDAEEGPDIGSVRETSITFQCSRAQKRWLQSRADEAGMTLLNYMRSRLGLRLERPGERKDLTKKKPEG